MVDATIVHHAGREVVIDLLVGEVDGVRVHDVRRTRPDAPARRRRR